MDIEIDQNIWRPEAPVETEAARPDWHGLRARLAAAHAARAACGHLAQGPAGSSFSQLSARKVAPFSPASDDVNLDPLGYVKPVKSIGEPVAGSVLPGGRG